MFELGEGVVDGGGEHEAFCFADAPRTPAVCSPLPRAGEGRG
ncbi:hypothetical protein CBM2600_A50068 [Cupriavidus taiwanensis]|nr:hypothetical protein CBM2600_A50068 [Cupriavidus taiwanensis]